MSQIMGIIQQNVHGGGVVNYWELQDGKLLLGRPLTAKWMLDIMEPWILFTLFELKGMFSTMLAFFWVINCIDNCYGHINLIAE